MKFTRLFSRFLILALALAIILAIAAFTPAVQTWIAQRALDKQPGLRATLGELSAGFGKVEVTDLRIEMEGAVFMLPSLEANLPVLPVLQHRKVMVQSLVAKGWTLNLSGAPDPNAPPAPASTAPASDVEGAEGASTAATVVPAQKVEYVFRGLLAALKLPCDLSVDGVEMEGDVLIAVIPGRPPLRLHTTMKGGGVAPGREGALAVEASGLFLDANRQPVSLSLHGSLDAGMDSPRTLSRIALKAELSVKGGSLREDLNLSVDTAANRGAGEETYRFDLHRDGRNLLNLLAHFPEARPRLEGTWKIDLRDADLVPLAGDRPLPSLAIAGEGIMDTDTAFARVHVGGRLNNSAGHLGVLAPALESLGTMTFEVPFELAHSGHSLHVEHLSVSLAGSRPVGVFHSLQPFDVDEKTGAMTLKDPRGDWIEGAVGGIPLNWLSGLANGVSFAGGDASGEFVIRAVDGGFTLRPKTALSASAVTVQRAGKEIGRGLDLSLSLLADYGSEGWQVQWAPLTISSAGKRLVTVEAKGAQPAKAEDPLVITGVWSADLEGWAASQPAIPGLSGITVRLASGDFTATSAESTKWDGKLALVGRDAKHGLTANFHADFGSNRVVAFRAPIKMTAGPKASELTVEGTFGTVKTGSRLDVRLTGKNADLAHLGLFAEPLASLGGVSLNLRAPSSGSGESRFSLPPSTVRDRLPFWGDLFGHVTFTFVQLDAGDRNFRDVRGTFEFDHKGIRLKFGKYWLPDGSLIPVEGAISFDPAATEYPYGLKVALAGSTVDGAPLFGAPPAGQDAAFKGKFLVESTITGNGVNLEDLVRRTQQEFRLTSTGGIVRLLRTHVTLSGPEKPTPVSDTVGVVGSAVGTLIGLKKDTIASGEVHLSKNADAVLDFSYAVAEIGYSEISLTAIRGSDQTIRFSDLNMISPYERVTGSGQITYAKGLALSAQPLSVDLQVSVRGKIAELLAKTDLLSAEKDSLGFTKLNQTAHFGGTLEHIDESQWRELLTKSAMRKPELEKKAKK